MKQLFLFLMLIILSINISFADNSGGLFFEPMVTYERGTGNVSFPTPINNSDTKVRGFGVGARFGFHLLDIVFLGADGRYALPIFQDSSLGQNIKSKSWNVGPVVGIQMPTILALRFWGSWIVAGQLDPDKDKGVEEKFKSARGWRVGGGFKFAILSLNLEYQYIKYDKTTVDQIGIFNTGFNSDDIKLTNKSVILSASFPIF